MTPPTSTFDLQSLDILYEIKNVAKIAELYTEIKEIYKKFKTNKTQIFFIAKIPLRHFYCSYYGNSSHMLFDTNDADETGSAESRCGAER